MTPGTEVSEKLQLYVPCTFFCTCTGLLSLSWITEAHNVTKSYFVSSVLRDQISVSQAGFCALLYSDLHRTPDALQQASSPFTPYFRLCGIFSHTLFEFSVWLSLLSS